MSDHPPLPDVLTDRDQWVCWRYQCRECWEVYDRKRDECDECDGDVSKVPVDSHTGSLAKSNDSATWSDLATAWEFHSDSDDSQGIGYMFDSDGLVVGVDLDDCRDPDTGEIDAWARDVVDRLDSFTEVSPSGTGLHVYVLGFLPDGRNRNGVGDGEIEMYDGKSARYFTVTGDHAEGTPETIEQRNDAVSAVHSEYVAEDDDDDDGGNETATTATPKPNNIDDSELIEKAKHADDGGKFKRLWRGDTSGYKSHSEARMALLYKLAFWTGGDRQQMDSLFRDSGLYPHPEKDGKWNRVGDDEIDSAISNTTDGYNPNKATDGGATTGTEPLDVVRDDYGLEPGDEPVAGGETGTQGVRSFDDEVRDAIGEFNDDVIQAKTARHRIAVALTECFDFVHPEEGVQGWRSTLHVFNDDEGIYEPRGKTFIKQKLERYAGDFLTNQVTNEIVGKVERMTFARGDQFDIPPERLVVGNGILDLHTGELSPYTPAEYHRTKIDIDWNPEAGEPGAIDEFLHEIVDGSDVTTLYRLVAHTIYKEYVSEKAAILIGGGENGKSVFLDLIEKFIGSYNVSHRELQDFSDDGFAANNLQGKLANLATEIGEQEVSDATTFKKLTGRDTMDARVKYEKPVTFENYATMMFATNEMPVFGEDNHAIWRRWVYVDFPHTFDADDPGAKDPEPKRVLMRRLTEERELQALLLRCQQEIQRWYEGEEWYADAMDPDQVRDKMKKAAEPVYAFATTCLEAGGEGDIEEKSVVRAAYRAYADEQDLPSIPNNEFGERLLNLRDFSIESGQDSKSLQHVYEGVTLSSRGRQVLGLGEPDDDDQKTVSDEYDSAKPVVMKRLREMVDKNGGDPVPREGVIWGCTNEIGKSSAEHALDELCKQGDVLDKDGRVIPT